jgi:hypothetical protein
VTPIPNGTLNQTPAVVVEPCPVPAQKLQISVSAAAAFAKELIVIVVEL